MCEDVENRVSITKFDSNKFAVFSDQAKDLTENIKLNIGNNAISMGQLERLRIPAGGATNWEIPDMMGPQSAKVLNGIIVYHAPTRIFWRDAYTGAKKRPDCWSPDAITGIGDPGGSCDLCEFAQWGSARFGKGQACKAQRNVFIVREEEMLPLVLTLPPTSLRDFDGLMLKLSSRGLPHYGIIVEFSLKRVEREGVPAYSQALFRAVAPLERQQIDRMAEYYEVMVPILRQRAEKIQEEELEDAPL
jgi:hypothetical protein